MPRSASTPNRVRPTCSLGAGAVWNQVARLTASDGTSNAWFGWSVSVSGNTVVVGSPNINTYQGAAYVFTKPGTGWADMTQTAELTASDGGPNCDFGASVSISGNTVAVGAYGPSSNKGEAYVFGPAPVVTSISPTSGPAAGGTTVTITGTAFTGATGVKFGTTPASSFTVNSATTDHGQKPGGHRHGGRDGGHDRRHFGHVRGRPVHLHRCACGDEHQSHGGAFGGRHDGDDHGDGLYGRHGGEVRRDGGEQFHGQLGDANHGCEPGGDGCGGRDRGHAGRHLAELFGRPVHLRRVYGDKRHSGVGSPRWAARR